MRETATAMTEDFKFTFTEAEKRVFRRPEKLTVSQWAEKYRYVDSGEKRGKWKNDNAPYAVEPMDCFSDPWIRTIILCFPPQIAKTQIALNCLGWASDQRPGPAMYLMPDEKTLRRHTKRKMLPFINGTPRIRDLMSNRSDDTTNTMIRFKNGMDLMLGWASSATQVSSESVQYMFDDEIDKATDSVGKEVADHHTLVEERTNAYPHTKKIMLISTINLEKGPIHRAMTTIADEIRYYHVKCPFCNEYQRMDFENIIWPKKERDPRIIRRKRLAEYQCTACGMRWNDDWKNEAVRNGKWIAENPVDRPTAIAFWLIGAWHSVFKSMSDAAAAFLYGQENKDKLKAFTTQTMNQPWKETIEPKKETEILSHCTDYPAMVIPPGVMALTAGIDVQKNGFWFVVRGWEEDLTSHLIQYGYLTTWDDVNTLIFETRYPVHGSSEKTMGIWRAAIDSGGGVKAESDNEMYLDDDWSRTDEVYEWVRANGRGIAFAIKGASRQLQKVKASVIDRFPGTNKPMKDKNGNLISLVLYLLHSSAFKDTIHWRLGRREADPENGREAESQRFYLHQGTGIDYAKQLLAEEKRRHPRTKVLRYVKTRRDNHLLDCEVYAAACVDHEWLPSLPMLLGKMKEERQKSEKSPKEGLLHDRAIDRIRSYKRPGWLGQR